jgi:tryptophan halogenase
MYCMGFRPDFSKQAYLYKEQSQAQRIIQQNQKNTDKMRQSLSSYREYIEKWLAKTKPVAQFRFCSVTNETLNA